VFGGITGDISQTVRWDSEDNDICAIERLAKIGG
jgi:hypothetical protein